jgi:hypothetical protein
MFSSFFGAESEKLNFMCFKEDTVCGLLRLSRVWLTYFGITISLLCVGVADATVVRFVADGTSLQGTPITDKYKFVGFVGDFIEFSDGGHEIAVDVPHSYKVKFTLTVLGSMVSVGNVTSEAPNCEQALQVIWPLPKVLPHQDNEKAVTISLAEPKFGGPTGQTECVSASMAGCMQLKIILDAKSEPIGAEIWIDGKKQPFQTNVTLSVPFCGFEKQKDVLLRRTDSVNCMRTIVLSPDAKISVNCRLQKP